MSSHCDGFVHNISRDGISINIGRGVKYEFVELRTFDLHDIPLEISGRIIYCKINSSGSFVMGVKLLGSSDENREFQKHILQHYRDTQKNLKINIVGFLSQ